MNKYVYVHLAPRMFIVLGVRKKRYLTGKELRIPPYILKKIDYL